MEDPYNSYCLDSAVAFFGRALEAELDGVEGKTEAERLRKRKIILSRFLDDEDLAKGVFADPATMVRGG